MQCTQAEKTTQKSRCAPDHDRENDGSSAKLKKKGYESAITVDWPKNVLCHCWIAFTVRTGNPRDFLTLETLLGSSVSYGTRAFASLVNETGKAQQIDPCKHELSLLKVVHISYML